jgi:hypothetical protein
VVGTEVKPAGRPPLAPLAPQGRVQEGARGAERDPARGLVQLARDDQADLMLFAALYASNWMGLAISQLLKTPQPSNNRQPSSRQE